MRGPGVGLPHGRQDAATQPTPLRDCAAIHGAPWTPSADSPYSFDAPSALPFAQDEPLSQPLAALTGFP